MSHEIKAKSKTNIQREYHIEMCGLLVRQYVYLFEGKKDSIWQQQWYRRKPKRAKIYKLNDYMSVTSLRAFLYYITYIFLYTTRTYILTYIYNLPNINEVFFMCADYAKSFRLLCISQFLLKTLMCYCKFFKTIPGAKVKVFVLWMVCV